jgi:3-oxoacyl-[acyl-carrier-protein] synthase-3
VLRFYTLQAHFFVNKQQIIMTKIRASITGVQGYVPDYILTNKEMETIVETSDEWIMSRTGIKQRHILKEEGKGSSYMAIKASQALVEKLNIDPTEIDMVICATITADMPFPANANIIATEIGATNAFGYDLGAACSGFLYALVTGSQFIETGKYKKVLIIGVDKMSSIIDYEDRTTCVIFGDGGGAVMLEPDTSGNGIQDSIMRSDGSGAKFLYTKSGGSVSPTTPETVANREHFVTQHGGPVFKSAVKSMAAISGEIMEKNNLTGDDISYLVPHQANKRIIDATAKRMGVSDDKVMLNIQNYGNTTAGTLPLCLWDYESKLKKGDNLILATFGGGFTWGSVYLKWAYDTK